MLLHDAVYPPKEPADVRFHHVLLTRFNMRVHRPDEFTVADLQRWVDSRTDVFKDVCLPSVTAQRCRPAVWYIGYDGMHPDMIEPLREICSGLPWVKFLPQGEDESFHTAFWRPVRRETPQSATHLITTRLDCDDALALNHLSSVQAYVRALVSQPNPPEDFWLSFPHGAQLVGGPRYSLYMHNQNHFLTRVVAAGLVPTGKGLTSLQGKHSRIFADGKTVFTPATSTPMWLQNVHGANALNQALPDPLVYQDSTRLAEVFGLA